MLLLRRQSAATYALFYFQKSNYNSKLIARARGQITIFQFFSTNLSQQNCRQFQKKLLHHIQKLFVITIKSWDRMNFVPIHQKKDYKLQYLPDFAW